MFTFGKLQKNIFSEELVVFKNGKQAELKDILTTSSIRIFVIAADNNWYFIHENCDSRDPMLIVKFVPEKDLPGKKTLFVLNMPYLLFSRYSLQNYNNERINWEVFVETSNSYSIPLTKNHALLHLKCEKCNIPTVAAFFETE